MVDNVDYTPGTGATIAADDIAGVLHQRIKLSVGADGSAADLDYGQEASAASIPVVIASDNTVTVDLGANNDVTVTGTVTATGPLTDTELRATPVVVDLGANNDVTVTGTVTATGPLTDTELRATPVVVDLGANNDVTVTGTVTADLGANNDVVVTANTTGGQSIHKSLDLDEGTLEVVKASAGKLYGMWITNTATATRWIKFYDATSGTIGTGTPVITFGIPGNSSDNIAANLGTGDGGITFSTGISVGCSTGFADADTGAPAANDVIINIFYA